MFRLADDFIYKHPSGQLIIKFDWSFKTSKIGTPIMKNILFLLNKDERGVPFRNVNLSYEFDYVLYIDNIRIGYINSNCYNEVLKLLK